MCPALPENLSERVRLPNICLQAADSSTVLDSMSGEFVLYWMRTAVRTDENPALDVARILASENQLPLLVYQSISEHYEFASDRHHTFMLEGARDVQQQLSELEISYAFYLPTTGNRDQHLVSLSNRAACVITEEMPVGAPKRFLYALAKKTSTPIISVDTACVAPMQMVKKPYTRAFEFRSATKKLYDQRLTKIHPKVTVKTQPFDFKLLPFAPVDLQKECIADLVSKCQIDHSVGPVVDTVGGSTAGYHRWKEFKENKLPKYAKQRNNALIDGVSRMSAYLHYGMVAPFRIAREAAEIKSGGAEKYLDELLVWRELAYAFCFHREDHDQWSAIPDWAQHSLMAHSNDPRSQLYSWEELARGETADPFWNAAQKSLLMQGELHNNVRMTWGKAILNWTRSPQEALSMMVDLNHRYALDGRDPASYGGILWCLGQFDRPFEPEQKVFGKVRGRTTESHAKRLDTKTYLQKVITPRFDPVPHVAVVGAGISGLFAARTLVDHGMKVSIFEKSRGVGGRMASRRVDGESRFDHGAQYFTARDPRFQRYVESWIEQKVVAPWPESGQRIVVLKNGAIESESSSQNRFVATPAMNSICKHLASGLNIEKQIRVGSVEKSDGRILLLDDNQTKLGTFDRVIVSAPASQAAELLSEFPSLSEPIGRIEMAECFAAMISFEKPITLEWVGAFLHDSFLTWAARNSSKPNRNKEFENLVLHADPKWTMEHWEEDPEKVAGEMLDEFWRVSGIEAQPNVHLQGHRWKFAIANANVENSYGCFFDRDFGIVACGDWANGSRVEGAFLSGMSAAGRILGMNVAVERNTLQQGDLFGNV